MKEIGRLSKLPYYLRGLYHLGAKYPKNGRVFIASGSTVGLSHSSKLELDGNFWLGAQPLYQNLILEGKPTQLFLAKKSLLKLKGNFTLGSGGTLFLGDNAKMTIGSKTYFNLDCKIFCKFQISLGANCAIAWNVTLSDSDFHPIIGKDKNPEEHREIPPSFIKIENKVWIGCNSTILKNVTIGEGSIIAANSVVNKDIPPFCLASGNPAKVIKENVTWVL